ncbi:MAG: fimbrillin family protein [Bacteroidales bacterium]|nr:fimbrillin family protein [Bacteroidales bacterium]
MKIYKQLSTLVALASILVAGCAKITPESGTGASREELLPMTFSASVTEEPESKAEIAGLDIKWTAGDEIGIFDGTAFRKFTLKSGAGSTSGVFEGEAAQAKSYTAVYPYNENLSIDSEGKIHGLSIPRHQTAGACPVIMTAKCENGGNAFAFKNALAYVKFTPEFDCNKVVLETYNQYHESYSRDLCGDVELVCDKSFNHFWSDYSDNISARVIANADNHIILDGDISAGGTYYMAVAPKLLEYGVKIIFDAKDDNLQYSKSSFSNRHGKGFLRGHVTDFGTFNKESTAWTERAVDLVLFDMEGWWEHEMNQRAIYDWRDFQRIVQYCKKTGSSSIAELTFMNDIDMGGRTVKPEKLEISGGVVFLYGNGHKLENYVQGSSEFDGDVHAGLYYAKKIHRLIIEGLNLYPTSFDVSSGGDIYGGAFVSKIHCDARLYINNCRVRGNISVKCTGNDQAYAGGFAGMAECPGEEFLSYSSDYSVEVKDCLMDGSVTAYSEDDIAYAGGFIGFIDAPDQSFSCKIWRSRNRADILAKGDDDSTSVSGADGVSAGGMVGCDRDHTTGGNVAIDLNSCVNEGSVTAHAMDNDNAFAGGMIGCHDSDGRTSSELYNPVYPSVSNCLNRGYTKAISEDSDDNAAGMVGYCYNDYTTFRNCVDNGELSGNVCAHISGTKGSYSGVCYWIKADSLPGIHDKYDHGQYEPGKMSGYKTDLAIADLHLEEGDASWIMRDNHLDLDIVR